MRLALFTILICAAASGCDSDDDPDVFVTGSLPSGIGFSIFNPQKVVAVHVVCDTGKGLKNLKWRLRGQATLSSIKYGEVPSGFAEENASEPLDSGVACGVLIEVQDEHGSRHSGGTYFIPMNGEEPRQFCKTIKQCYRDMLNEVT
jgi:hypothetical protein